MIGALCVPPAMMAGTLLLAMRAVYWVRPRSYAHTATPTTRSRPRPPRRPTSAPRSTRRRWRFRPDVIDEANGPTRRCADTVPRRHIHAGHVTFLWSL